jgi:L-2-hydroxyglutarate oxidase
MEQFDVVVIGGGIVGLATAFGVVRRQPGKSVVVLEKEDGLAAHQTGHNSGVLHSGIYYRPGSLKAENCRDGRTAMIRFCEEEGIDHEICGKVIVAVDEAEIPRLENIYRLGQENGVRCEMVDGDRLREIEPHAHGRKAVHVPDAGIVNFRQVCARLADLVKAAGGDVRTGVRVTGITVQKDGRGATVISEKGEFGAGCVVNCAGLYSDKVTAMTQSTEVKIIPFRGEYYELKPEAYQFCRNLIYPVPDPEFPFLGVHFTRMIDGTVECGPNAVLAFAREGYQKTDINLLELMDTLTYPAFWKVAVRYWRMGAGEMWRSLSKRAFVRALQRLVPDIREEHLVPAPAGIRAQALAADGKLVDDFFIQSTGVVVNVGNAPSPAATASLNIGKLIAEQLPLEGGSDRKE